MRAEQYPEAIDDLRHDHAADAVPDRIIEREPVLAPEPIETARPPHTPATAPDLIDRTREPVAAPEPVEREARDSVFAPEPIEVQTRTTAAVPEPVDVAARPAAVAPETIEVESRASATAPEVIETAARESAHAPVPLERESRDSAADRPNPPVIERVTNRELYDRSRLRFVDEPQTRPSVFSG